MYFRDGVELATRASTLIRELLDGIHPTYGVGSGVCSIYDTAWVSLVAKTIDGHSRWLFPSSFRYLLDHQQHDGGWQSASSDADGIMHSLAALLSICRHINHPHQMKEGFEDLKNRKFRAIYFLETKFAACDSDNPDGHFRFHPLATKLLQMLQAEGIEFSFNGKDLFLPRTENSSAKLNVPIKPSTSSNDQGKQIKVYGSINASPAATAMYLMDHSTWDDEAEAYLSYIISACENNHTRGVPAKFPTTVFEVSGVLTTLLENGFTHKDLSIRTLGNAAKLLEECMQLESGVIGFAPYVESDAVNTAKTISALCLLGQTVSPQGLIIRYETREYFKTYTHDQNPSFVTNCHVLKALLDLLPGNGSQMPQIEKTVRFLCNRWWTTNGQLEDQSNVSTCYSTMLMVQAFIRLLALWEADYIPAPLDPFIKDKVIISLFQALTRTLQTQSVDGSWGHGSCEITAYAIISLSKLSMLSSAPKMRLQVTQAIENGRKFLVDNFRAFSEPDRVWKGLTTSGNNATHQAYVLAALRVPISDQRGAATIERYFGIPLARVTIQTKYYARHAWFASIPEWLIQASLIETYLFLPQIRDVRCAVFPSQGLSEDRYFESIPFAWIMANNLDHRSIGAEFLYQLTIIYILTRQFEEYVENVVGETFAGCLFEVEDLVHGIYYELETDDKSKCYCDNHGSNETRSSTGPTISEIRSVLYRFISYIVNHPYVLMASFSDQSNLRSELLSFLLSRFSQVGSDRSSMSATDQTAHPYTYAFLACLVGNQSTGEGIGLRRDFLNTPEQQYLAADMCRHMSIINFMSVNTDSQPNPEVKAVSAKSRSTSFGTDGDRCGFSRPESSASTTSSSYGDSMSPISPISSISSVPSGSPGGGSYIKSPALLSVTTAAHSPLESLQMARLINHERRCLNLCLDGLLEAGVNRRTNNIIRLFVDATALSEQIFQDPNIGSICSSKPTHDQVPILDPPPVPPKRRRGSVAAARAALITEPLTANQETEVYVKQEEQQRSNATKPFSPHPERRESPNQNERDWSWNKPTHPTKRTSRALSEISRIESIMSEIDGFKLDMNPQSIPETPPPHKRTTSENDTSWIQPPKPTPASPKRLTNNTTTTPPADAETIKLAKIRLETQRRLKHEAQKQAKAAEIAAHRQMANDLQSKAMNQIASSEREAKRRVATTSSSSASMNAGWVKAPPPAGAGVDNGDGQAKRLQRASKWGGPKWKAPF